jgi:hypothetical protein
MSVYDVLMFGQPRRIVVHSDGRWFFLRGGGDAMHCRTFIEPTEITVQQHDAQRRLVAFRAYCTCGWTAPVPRRSQLDANADAHEHRKERHHDDALEPR